MAVISLGRKMTSGRSSRVATLALVLAALGLSGCGARGLDVATSRSHKSAVSSKAVGPSALAFFTRGSTVLTALVAGSSDRRTRSCRQTAIVRIDDGLLMEIDLFGQRAPSCAVAIAQLRRVPGALRVGVGGAVGTWRCAWTRLPAVGCRRGKVLLAASNPGE